MVPLFQAKNNIIDASSQLFKEDNRSFFRLCRFCLVDLVDVPARNLLNLPYFAPSLGNRVLCHLPSRLLNDIVHSIYHLISTCKLVCNK